MRRSLDSSDQSLLAYTQDKVSLVDESGEFRYVNEAAGRILGYDPETLVGENAFELMHPDDREACRDCFDRVITSDEPTTETTRYRFRAADDSWVWMESRFSNITDDDLGGYVVSSRDVTETVRAEQKRDTAESRLQEIATTISDPVWMYSGDWTELLFISPAYEEIYGQSIETLREDPLAFLDTVHPDDVPCVEDAMGRMAEGESVNVEYRVNAEADYDTYVWVQGEPIVEDGEVHRIVGFTRDITDRHRRERQLTVMDNLLRHNLRNDLSVILGKANQIEQSGDEEMAGHAAIIRQFGTDLLATAEKQRAIIDLLTGIQRPGTIDVAETAEQAARNVSERYPAAAVRISTPGSIEAQGLAELQAAFVELLENALEHTESGDSAVDVEIRVEGDDVLVRFTDDCPPIPDEEYRVLTGEKEMTEVYHSTGLGLWLVYWAVDLSGGQVTFSRAADGNEITIQLPRAADDSM
ncbi:PAS domain-containing sensor histidine kinase [Natranaeroarchaeum aerophilus]|uniref:histidine kinase n=1 Tax=Natranaeroarchaeum aerophilus TaxID=2917711 RepID=A0AAE3FT55_9EURY|nr:PAS domain S-box protein [Natranaeroarchaeum aerophilus]MCL9814473.1 PAS domain S-box protein [Natranaeroarchaeum aerophilus]